MKIKSKVAKAFKTEKNPQTSLKVNLLNKKEMCKIVGGEEEVRDGDDPFTRKRPGQ